LPWEALASFFPQLADEHVDDLELRLVHAAVEVATLPFAKLKTLLRKAAARTRDTLWDAIADILSAFTINECANYLAHAGYASS
jgi:hypothetical protein